MKFLTIIASIFLFAGAAIAQTGTVSGTVTFTDGSALHDASVQLVQTRQTTRTDENGGYRFENVPPGRYTVLVHLEGFADASKSATVTSGGAVALDFQLQIASLEEQVTVTASGAEQSILDSFQ